MDRKDQNINLRVSKSQMEALDAAKKDILRCSNTDIVMSGLHLLNILASMDDRDESYRELINALIIQDDLIRCIAKPDNPQIDNQKNKRELMESKEKNEIRIKNFLKILLSTE